MHNEKYEQNLLQYFYGELSGKDKKEFSDHLASCDICKMQLKELENLSLHLEQGKKPPADEILTDIFDKTFAKPGENLFKKIRKIISRRFYKPALVFTGVVLIAVVFDIYRKTPQIYGDLWFGDLYAEIDTVNDDIAKMDDYFALGSYIIETKLDELEKMTESFEVAI